MRWHNAHQNKQKTKNEINHWIQFFWKGQSFEIILVLAQTDCRGSGGHGYLKVAYTCTLYTVVFYYVSFTEKMSRLFTVL